MVQVSQVRPVRGNWIMFHFSFKIKNLGLKVFMPVFIRRLQAGQGSHPRTRVEQKQIKGFHVGFLGFCNVSAEAKSELYLKNEKTGS